MEDGRMYSGYYKLTKEDLKDMKIMSTREIVAAALSIDEKDVCCEKCIWSSDSLVGCMMRYKTVEYDANDGESYCKLFMPKSERSK